MAGGAESVAEKSGASSEPEEKTKLFVGLVVECTQTGNNKAALMKALQWC